jgi:hypothetical protein
MYYDLVEHARQAFSLTAATPLRVALFGRTAEALRPHVHALNAAWRAAAGLRPDVNGIVYTFVVGPPPGWTAASAVAALGGLGGALLGQGHTSTDQEMQRLATESGDIDAAALGVVPSATEAALLGQGRDPFKNMAFAFSQQQELEYIAPDVLARRPYVFVMTADFQYQVVFLALLSGMPGRAGVVGTDYGAAEGALPDFLQTLQRATGTAFGRLTTTPLDTVAFLSVLGDIATPLNFPTPTAVYDAGGGQAELLAIARPRNCEDCIWDPLRGLRAGGSPEEDAAPAAEDQQYGDEAGLATDAEALPWGVPIVVEKRQPGWRSLLTTPGGRYWLALEYVQVPRPPRPGPSMGPAAPETFVRTGTVIVPGLGAAGGAAGAARILPKPGLVPIEPRTGLPAQRSCFIAPVLQALLSVPAVRDCLGALPRDAALPEAAQHLRLLQTAADMLRDASMPALDLSAPGVLPEAYTTSPGACRADPHDFVVRLAQEWTSMAQSLQPGQQARGAPARAPPPPQAVVCAQRLFQFTTEERTICIATDASAECPTQSEMRDQYTLDVLVPPDARSLAAALRAKMALHDGGRPCACSGHMGTLHTKLFVRGAPDALMVSLQPVREQGGTVLPIHVRPPHGLLLPYWNQDGRRLQQRYSLCGVVWRTPASFVATVTHTSPRGKTTAYLLDDLSASPVRAISDITDRQAMRSDVVGAVSPYLLFFERV